MSWKNVFHSSYWLVSPVIVQPKVLLYWVLVSVVFIGLGAFALLIRSKQTEVVARTLLKRWSAFSFTLGFLSLVLLALRQQNAFILSWRLWYAVVVLSIAPWFYRLSYYTFKRWPEIRAENAARNLKARYLPANSK